MSLGSSLGSVNTIAKVAQAIEMYLALVETHPLVP